MCPDQTASACQAGVLAGVADAVLPAVLSLLRSRSREVIKAVLGFVKVRLVSPCNTCQVTSYITPC